MDVYVIWSFYLGVICAGSLMLGAVIGVKFQLSKSTVGTLAAFGAGALLCALGLELVAPTVEAMLQASGPQAQAQEIHHFLSLIGGAALGGLIFVALDQLLIEHGGYLRKTAYILAQQSRLKKAQRQALLRDIASSHFFCQLTPQEVGRLVERLQPAFFPAGETLFRAGDAADQLIWIRRGNAQVLIEGAQAMSRSAGDLIGEIPILAQSVHISDCIAQTQVEALTLSRQEVNELMRSSPRFLQAMQAEAALHLMGRRDHLQQSEGMRKAWIRASIDAAEHGQQLPSAHEMAQTHAAHSNAAVAIWLGNLLDGIPESVVLGTLLTAAVASKVASGSAPDFAEVLPYTLIAGLFLSNLPEALSSSAQMRAQGMSARRIYAMWGSLVLLTGLGAALGAVLGEHIPHSVMIFAEGVAAGAMLTMVCSAMLPEATQLASPNTAGLFTLGGFLSALLFKLLEL